MKCKAAATIALALLLILSACGQAPEAQVPQDGDTAPASDVPDGGVPGTPDASSEAEDGGEEKKEEEKAVEKTLRLYIGGKEIAVHWEENESVEALAELAAAGPVTVEMSMYGGFEQVGPLGVSLPSSDVRTTTSAGDIVLYSDSRIVIFYGSNTWEYTRLGRITGMTEAELGDLLGNGDVTLTITYG